MCVPNCTTIHPTVFLTDLTQKHTWQVIKIHLLVTMKIVCQSIVGVEMFHWFLVVTHFVVMLGKASEHYQSL